MENKKDIRALSREQLRDFFVGQQDKPFRGNQVYDWLWAKGAHTFDEMSNLSKETRALLQTNFVINHIKVDEMQRSGDGTIKNAIKLHDGLVVESVLIPTQKRTTACVSSQVGCSLNCSFCATARLKKMRNLNPDEIYDQVLAIDQQSRHYFHHPLSNIVFMGMGEPFHNYDETMTAIDRLNDAQGFNLGARRFTVSTVGLIPAIKRFTQERRQVNLAISLHAADDELRSSLLPVNRKFPLEPLLSACTEYFEATGRRITFEWALIQDVNDICDMP